MITPWDNDVAEAVRRAYAGVSDNWPLTARTLATELAEVRKQLNDKLAEDLKRCPRCHVVALGVVVEEGKPTRYHHETTTHFDLLTDLTV